jgi:hypothetical protein
MEWRLGRGLGVDWVSSLDMSSDTVPSLVCWVWDKELTSYGCVSLFSSKLLAV